MTTGEQSGGKHSRDDILAGEYVLGVLPLEKRRELERRMQDDAAFAQLVQRWEAEFSDFNADYQEQAPSATVLARIEERLFGSRTVNTNGSLWNSASFWRWISVATSAAAVTAIVYAAFPEKWQGATRWWPNLQRPTARLISSPPTMRNPGGCALCLLQPARPMKNRWNCGW